MYYDPIGVTTNFSDETDSILFPNDPEQNPNATNAFHLGNEADEFLGLFESKQKRAEKKLAKAEKKLAKGKTAKAEKKLSKAEKLLSKAGTAISDPNADLTSRIGTDLASIQFNKQSPALIKQIQDQTLQGMQQSAIASAQERAGQIGAAAGDTTPYADTSGGGGGGLGLTQDTGTPTDNAIPDTITTAPDTTITAPTINNTIKYVLIGVAVIVLSFVVIAMIKHKK
jgi:hypothetical protein